MNDIRRTILWVIFGFSMVLLWDKWQLHNGNKATFFPTTPAEPVYYDAPPPRPRYRDNRVVGQAVGAIAGGVIGNQIGRGSGRIAATAVGAVVGSMVGARVVDYPY